MSNKPQEDTRPKKQYTFIQAVTDTDNRCLMQEFPIPFADFSLKGLIDAYLRTKNGRTERTGGWLRPSGLGFCDRSVYYDVTNTEGTRNVEPKSQKVMAIGTMIHEQYQKWIREALEEDPREFKDELPIRFEPFRISGQVDGIFYIKDWVLEIKTISKAAFEDLTKPRPKDLLQSHVYMYLLNIPRCIMYYVCRDNGEDKEFRVTFSLKTWAKIETLLEELALHKQRGTLPKRIDSTFFCKDCKYLLKCQGDPAGVKIC